MVMPGLRLIIERRWSFDPSGAVAFRPRDIRNTGNALTAIIRAYHCFGCNTPEAAIVTVLGGISKARALFMAAAKKVKGVLELLSVR